MFKLLQEIEKVRHPKRREGYELRFFTKREMTILALPAILVTLYSLLFTPARAHAALLYSQTANQTVTVGETFTMYLLIDTQGQSINSVDLAMHFTSDTLQALTVGAGSSQINLWLKNPAFDNSAGTISLTGGIAGEI